MTTDIVKGMARASYEAVSIKNSYAEASPATQEVCEEAMHAALLWLAERLESKGKHFVAGEIRAAAEDEGA
jgi:hypothetical protein